MTLISIILLSYVFRMNYHEYMLSATRASLAYKPFEEIQEIWPTNNTRAITFQIFKNVQDAPKHHKSDTSSAHAYSWIQSGVFYLSFRGTNGAPDYFTDIDILRTYLFKDNASILVHTGFLNYFNSLKESIMDELKAKINHFHTIQVTGHSLGGGLATIAAATLGALINNPHKEKKENNFKTIDQTKKRIVCHTIGSPRVGNTGFVKWFHEHVDESIRITNSEDPVTLFPISCFYTHVSDSICIDDKCVVKRSNSDVKWYRRLFSLPFEIDFRNPIIDHSCNVYISRLLTLSNQTSTPSVKEPGVV